MARKLLLACGIFASVVYVGADILAATRFEGYSYSSQMVSELMAIGAPTRPLLVAPFTLHNLLVVAFSVGVWLAACGTRPARVTSVLLCAYGVVGEAALLFAPMHMRGAEKSATDTMHIVATTIIVILTLLFIAFGALARGRRFRLYSIATLVALVVCGALAGFQGPRVGANLPTPGFGIIERVNIYLSLVWIAVLASALVRSRYAAPLQLEETPARADV